MNRRGNSHRESQELLVEASDNHNASIGVLAFERVLLGQPDPLTNQSSPKADRRNFLPRNMGVNQRKNKQAPVPTLEEALPKKFKSDKVVKGKKKNVHKEPKARRDGTAEESKEKEEIPVAEFDDEREEDEETSFGAVKASLFDDDDDDEEQDEFEIEQEDDLYHLVLH